MKSKRILALILGAIIASGSVSQAAMQVYADLEDSSSPESISESVPEITEAEPLTKMTNLSGSKIEKRLISDINTNHLYISSSKLVFELLENNEAKLVCYDGDQSDVTVPQYVSINDKTYPVISIGVEAFYQCESLKSIVLPKDLKEIGMSTFEHCKNLKSIVLPKNLEKIDSCAFYGCRNLELDKLPDDVTEIGHSAFEACTNLKSIKIPKGVTKIDGYAFCRCKKLRSIVLPKDLKEIGMSTFEHCENLKSIEIPKGVTKIGSYTFQGCTNLKSIKIPNNLQKIGDCAFERCTNLKSIRLPKDLEKIGDFSFTHCTNLKSIDLPDDVTEIGNYAFSDCTNLQSVYLPDGVTKISQGTFVDCTNLKSIRLPDSITEIGTFAFKGCRNLKLDKLPDDVTEIGTATFKGCRNLKLDKLPDDVTEIGNHAFVDTNISDITIPASVTYLRKGSFEIIALRRIRVEVGSQLNYENIMSACGIYINQVVVDGVNMPPRPIYKTINNLDELIGQNDECKCPICQDEIIAGEEVAELPCTHIYHYMHRVCFEDFIQDRLNNGLVMFNCPQCRKEYPIEDLD